MISHRKRVYQASTSPVEFAAHAPGRFVHGSCEEQVSPAKRGSGGQWGGAGVAGDGRAPTLAQVEGHGEVWLGLRAPQAKRSQPKTRPRAESRPGEARSGRTFSTHGD